MSMFTELKDAMVEVEAGRKEEGSGQSGAPLNEEDYMAHLVKVTHEMSDEKGEKLVFRYKLRDGQAADGRGKNWHVNDNFLGKVEWRIKDVLPFVCKKLGVEPSALETREGRAALEEQNLLCKIHYKTKAGKGGIVYNNISLLEVEHDDSDLDLGSSGLEDADTVTKINSMSREALKSFIVGEELDVVVTKDKSDDVLRKEVIAALEDSL